MEAWLIVLIQLLFVEILALAVLFVLAKRKGFFEKRVKGKREFNFNKVKEMKWEHWVVVCVYLIVIGFLGYIFLSNYFPDLMRGVNSGDYSVDLNGAGLLNSFYFQDDVLDDGVVVSEKITSLVFKPKKIVSATEGVIFIEGVNNGTELYIEDRLVVPDLSSYVKVKDFSDVGVWVRDDFSYSGLVDKVSVEDYIYFNFPQASVYSFKELGSSVPELTDWTNEETEIDAGFTKNIKIAIYHGGGLLKINGEKEDTNIYKGKDEYTARITSLEGGLIYEEILEDDGERQDTGEKGEEQDFKINLNLEKGIYYADFIIDSNNRGADTTLKNIVINSNKLLLVNKFQLTTPFEFYKETKFDSQIGFRIWSGSSEQKVIIGREKLKLGEDELKKDVFKEILPGKYEIKVEEGQTIVYSSYISPSEENWFEIPVNSEEKVINENDILVIDKSWLKIDSSTGEFSARVDVNVDIDSDSSEDKWSFQVLDAGKLKLNELRIEV